MSATVHIPVLLDEVIAALEPKPGSTMVDCTLNGGGHTSALASRGARVLGIEWDPAIARPFFERHSELAALVTVVNDSYTNLEDICREHDVVPDGILFDLGPSSLHYESSGRGFSFMRPDEPLDMRFNPEKIPRTAGTLVNTEPVEELERVLTEYGEEQFAGQIAAAINIARRAAPLRTVGDLVSVIEGAVPAWYRHRKLHPATKTFQALRIAVNDELENVRKGVTAAMHILKPGGVLAVIAFHGSEDRLVRELFKEAAKAKRIEWVRRATTRPLWGEVKKNPRARSAKLKLVRKLSI